MLRYRPRVPDTPFPRSELPTPALVLDVAAMDRNIAAMAEWAAARGLALRPHAKTHKSGEIAKRQIAAGAVGICCAKLGEAEALAGEGIADIHITSPVVPAQAVALARAIAAAGLRFEGVQYYCGSEQHIPTLAGRRAAIVEKTDYLKRVLAALEAAGLAVPVVTGGGTGTFAIDAELGVLTELQVGSYIFLDREYRDCELAGPGFEQALWVDASVISANTPGMVTIDAGLKAFATDAGVPIVAEGDVRYDFMGDEHGALIGESLPRLGARVTLVPPHCDPTVNLYDAYWLVERETVAGAWPVTARGRSS